MLNPKFFSKHDRSKAVLIEFYMRQMRTAAAEITEAHRLHNPDTWISNFRNLIELSTQFELLRGFHAHANNRSLDPMDIFAAVQKHRSNMRDEMETQYSVAFGPSASPSHTFPFSASSHTGITFQCVPKNTMIRECWLPVLSLDQEAAVRVTSSMPTLSPHSAPGDASISRSRRRRNRRQRQILRMPAVSVSSTGALADYPRGYAEAASPGSQCHHVSRAQLTKQVKQWRSTVILLSNSMVNSVGSDTTELDSAYVDPTSSTAKLVHNVQLTHSLEPQPLMPSG